MTLLKRLQDKRDWLAQTNGLKHASAQLTRDDLDQIIEALSPRKSGLMDPPGTRRTPEEIVEMRAKENIRKPLQNCA